MILGPDGKPYQQSAPPEFLKAIPLPRKRETKITVPKRAGTPPKFEAKLHCNYCGKKRLMRIASMVLDPEGNTVPLYFGLKKLLRATKTPIALPESYLGYCMVCLEVTPFRLNKNRKLVAEHPNTLQIGTEILDNERTNPLHREVPSDEDPGLHTA